MSHYQHKIYASGTKHVVTHVSKNGLVCWGVTGVVAAVLATWCGLSDLGLEAFWLGVFAAVAFVVGAISNEQRCVNCGLELDKCQGTLCTVTRVH